MAEIKAHEFDQFLKRRARDYRIFLIYGPDRGLVSERAAELAKMTGVDMKDAFSFMRLDASDIAGDPGRLFDEAYATGLFGGEKLIWIKGAGADKGLADAVSALAAKAPDAAWILIEAGDLKKGAPLRTTVEAAQAAVALPCYADDGRDLEALIDRELTRAGMTMTLEARQALRRNLGGDRLASVGEIEKLALHALGKGEITLEDVRALSGDVSGQSFEDAVDAMLEGRVSDFDAAFTRQCQAGGPPFLALAGAMRQMQGLHAMRGELDAGGRGATAVVAAQKPPVFFARRKLVEKALERWSRAALERALERLQAAVLQTRRRADLSQSIARQALLGIAVESARLNR